MSVCLLCQGLALSMVVSIYVTSLDGCLWADMCVYNYSCMTVHMNLQFLIKLLNTHCALRVYSMCIPDAVEAHSCVDSSEIH